MSEVVDFQALFEASPDLYLVLSATFEIVAASDAYLRSTMTRREEILGRNVFDVFPDDPSDSAADGVRKLRASLERVRDELVADRMAIQRYPVRRPESEGGGFEDRFWSPVNSPVLAANGRLAYILHRVEDVTGFRSAEDALRDANEFLEAVVENIPHMVFVKDADRLAFVRFNRAGEELLGVPRAELLGKNDYDFFPKEQADFFQSKDRETLRNARMVEVDEEPLQTAKGPRLLHTKKVPILASDGSARYLLGISEDITDRKKGDTARATLAAIVESSDDAILSKTFEGIITSWNGGAERLFGYRADEIVGQSIAMLVPPDRIDAEWQLLARLRRGDRIDHFDTVRRRKDGSEIDVSVTTSAIRGASGEPTGICTIARDVTEAKRAKLDLVRAKETAEAAIQELEAFSYSVAHDLRAPLRSIDGFSQALLEDYGDVLDQQGKNHLGFVRSSSQLMAELIDGMLVLSRVTRQELQRRTVDLSALAQAVVARLRRTETARDVEIQIQGGLVCQGDPRLVAVVVENLMGNAWKFTRRRDRARIEFGAVRKDGKLVYFLRDNGAGFDMRYASKLFGAFQRLHSVQQFEGTGIGLATVQRVVRRHGGRIWAEGQLDAGATFFFTLNDEGPST